MRKITFLLIVLCLFLSNTSVSFSKDLLKTQEIEKWKIFTRNDEGSDLQIGCSGWSKTSWFVWLKDGKVEFSDKGHPHQDKIVFPVEDGYFIALDNGEFGGSLWWHSNDGQFTKELLNEHINYFIQTTSGLYAMGGLSHLGTDSGQIIKLEKANGDWTQKKIHDLGSAPNAFYKEDTDNYLILTRKSILRFNEKSGISNVYLRNDGEYLRYSYSTSIVKDKDGVLYLGMRYAIVKLTPKEDFYIEEWLIPNYCNWEVESNRVCHCK